MCLLLHPGFISTLHRHIGEMTGTYKKKRFSPLLFSQNKAVQFLLNLFSHASEDAFIIILPTEKCNFILITWKLNACVFLSEYQELPFPPTLLVLVSCRAVSWLQSTSGHHLSLEAVVGDGTASRLFHWSVCPKVGWKSSCNVCKFRLRRCRVIIFADNSFI